MRRSSDLISSVEVNTVKKDALSIWREVTQIDKNLACRKKVGADSVKIARHHKTTAQIEFWALSVIKSL